MGRKLIQDDKIQVYEAIAFVISAMPMQRAATSLQEFAVDIIQLVEVTVRKRTAATKAELRAVAGKTYVLRPKSITYWFI
jgi:transportin-3